VREVRRGKKMTETRKILSLNFIKPLLVIYVRPEGVRGDGISLLTKNLFLVDSLLAVTLKWGGKLD